MGELTNFFVTLGIKIKNSQWSSAAEKIQSFRKDFLNLSTAITASVIGLALFEDKIANSVMKMSNMSQRLQLPINQLRVLQVVANQTGLPFQNLTDAIGTFQDAFANMSIGQAPSENMLYGLGILDRLTNKKFDLNKFRNMADGSFQAFKSLFEQLNKVGNVKQREGILDQIFGNDNLLPLVGHVNMLRQAYEQLQKRGLLITPDQIANAQKFKTEIGFMGMEFDGLFQKLGLKLMPAFTDFYQQLDKIASNPNFLKGLQVIALAIESMTINLAKLITKIYPLYIGTQHIDDKIGDVVDAFSSTAGFKAALKSTGFLQPAVPSNQAGFPSQQNISNNNTQNSSQNSNVTHNTTNNTVTTNVHTQSPLQYISGKVTGGFR
jgi:hypothetical protein